MNDPLEHDVYKPVSISHLSYLVSFTSYFCGSSGFNKVILIKMPGALIFTVTLPNLMDFLTIYISNLALAGIYLAQLNVVNHYFF